MFSVSSKLTNRVPGLHLKLSSRARDVVAIGAHALADEARRRAPFRTGFLRNSILTKQVNQYRTDVIVEAFYGVFLEFGTSRMAPHPFFIPAIEAVKDRFIKQAADALKNL